MVTPSSARSRPEAPRPGHRRLRSAALAAALVVAPALALGSPASPAGAATAAPAPGPVGVVELDSPAQGNSKTTVGIVSGTVYFNKPETATLASSSLGGLCAALAAVPPPAGQVLRAACGLKAAEWRTIARLASQSDQCVKIKFGAGYAGLPMQRYTGGYCTK